MTRTYTKTIERRQIEKFISNKSHGIDFILLEEYETPDFIAKTLDTKISIEHTRYIDEKNKMIERYRQQIIDAARERFEREVGVNLQVSFRYSHNPMDKEHKKQFYIDMLFDMVNKIYQVNKEYKFRVSTSKMKVENKYIDSLTVQSETTWSNWQSTGAFLVKPADYKQVQKYIDKKSALICNYPIDIDEKWLVIIAGIGYRSSGFRFDLLDCSNLSRKKFNRVFFFDERTEKIIELL
ncbi:hypothetical protein [Zunongwangia sp. H14]|uniref:hypothetical protein n=1 Tax=Zunongwangia sp. H14 TaxID=3240792 RepID=UPI0035684B94